MVLHKILTLVLHVLPGSLVPNLVPRVFRLFGQRGNAGKTLGTSKKFNFFDWLFRNGFHCFTASFYRRNPAVIKFDVPRVFPGRYFIYGNYYVLTFYSDKYVPTFYFDKYVPKFFLKSLCPQCYSVTLLPCYSVTLLLCYLVTLLPCYLFTLLPC